MKPVFLILAFLFSTTLLHAQCNAYVNVFPYQEGFETSNGNWVTGGTASDWVWGAPNKQVITKAATGNKCWIVGGLSKNSYNDRENSWLKSPCFDFSKLKNPRISFNIFWETEKRYDGVLFQYSIDYGNTWVTIGDANQTNDCNHAWWYNNSNVVYLNNSAGWSGNIQSSNGNCLGGEGSGDWYNARQPLTELAGQVTVTFRFLFASGSTCNEYDGFAVDDIFIGESESSQPDFSFQCASDLDVLFNSAESGCAQSYQWNFGDPGSDPRNISTDLNPIHTFSSTGTFNVTLSVTSTSGNVKSITKHVTVIDASITQTAAINCYAESTASAAVNIGGSLGPFTYLWNTTPAQTTGEATNLPAGTYSVTVEKDSTTCPVTASITIQQPSVLTASANITNPVCTGNNGVISLYVEGGTPSYNYLWSPVTETSGSINNLAAGTYTYTVTDNNGCSVKGSASLTTINDLSISLGSDTTICQGDKIVLSPGSFATYLWQNNTTNSSYTVTQEGSYSVTVTDQYGCVAESSIKIVNDCGEILFPNAFTPNGDNINDGFGPLGNRSAMANYSLRIYNRWGQLVFQTTDPFKKWYGARTKTASSMNNIFVWITKFDYHDTKNITRKGTVLALY